MTPLHNQWATREVYFDEDGNPTAHRERKPLTDEQIIDLFNEACRETFNGLERYRYFARAIEAAHVITGGAE